MAKKLLGHCKCPECGFDDAEIGEDKSGNPYRYCPDCTSQYFTRGDATKVANLKKKMRPLKGAPPAPAPAPGPAPGPASDAVDPPKKKRGALEEYLEEHSKK